MRQVRQMWHLHEAVHFSGSTAHVCPQVLTDGGDIKTQSITQKLSPFWLPETPITE